MKEGNCAGIITEQTLKNVLILETMAEGRNRALGRLQNVLISHQESWQLFFGRFPSP